MCVILYTVLCRGSRRTGQSADPHSRVLRQAASVVRGIASGSAANGEVMHAVYRCCGGMVVLTSAAVGRIVRTARADSSTEANI